MKAVLHQLATKHYLVVVLMEKLPHLDRMPRDVKKISLAKMDHLVVVQTNGLLRKDLISRDASSVLKRFGCVMLAKKQNSVVV